MSPNHSKNDFWAEFFKFLRLVYRKDPLVPLKFPVLLGIFVIAPMRGEIEFQVNESLIVILLIVMAILILNFLCRLILDKR